MKNLRLLALALVLALTFTVTGGGFAPEAEANHCNGPYACTNDDQCWITCCTMYGCSSSYPPFCSFFDETSTCGTCFC